MTPYFLVAGSAVLLALLSRATATTLSFRRASAQPNRTSKPSTPLTPLDIALVALLTLFAGLRASAVGTDTHVYARNFELADPQLEWLTVIDSMPFDFGYTTAVLVIKWLGGDFQTLLIVFSALTVCSSFWAIRRASINTPMAIALYILLAFYLTPFNLLRQGLAVSLLFLGATFIPPRKLDIGRDGGARGWVAFAFLTLIAFSMHGSAIVVAPLMVIFRGMQASIRKLGFVLLISAVLAVPVQTSNLTAALAEAVNPRYEGYLEAARAGGVGTYLVLVGHVFLLGWALALRPTGQSMTWAAYSLVGTAFLAFGTVSVVAARTGMFFSIFLCLLLPKAFERLSIMPKIVLFSFALFYYGFYIASFGDLTPYSIAR